MSAERELLVLQGLEDLDIQEDQNAVFVCEISVEDVPGEWYRNGERIQPTSTVKIRQEGQHLKFKQEVKRWMTSILFLTSFRNKTFSPHVQRAT